MQESPQERLVYEHQAGLAKVMGNPDRLRILRWIRYHGESETKEIGAAALSQALRLNKANLSRHLSKMREVGLVRTRKEGAYLCVREANPEIGHLCESMRGLIASNLREQAAALETFGEGQA